MGWNNWTEFKPFTDYFEIKHLVGYQGRRGLWKTTLEKKTGHLSQADGLFPVQGGAFDHNINVPVGIYFIRIAGGENHHRSGFFDYIGLSTPSDKGRSKFQKGIYSRIFEHYGKILGIPQRGDIGNYINAKKKSEMKRKRDYHLEAQTPPKLRHICRCATAFDAWCWRGRSSRRSGIKSRLQHLR